MNARGRGWYNVNVRWLAKSVAWVLVAFWLPVTMHCALENVGGFQFLVCCLHGDTAPHQDNDCSEDACAVVESGGYMVPSNRITLVPPLVLAAQLVAVAEAELPVSEIPRFSALSTSPPELPSGWQFSLRAAAPVRAPSFAS